MITNFITRLFPSPQRKAMARYRAVIPEIRSREERWMRRGQDEMRQQVSNWRTELSAVPASEVVPRLRSIRLNVLGLVCAAAAQLCGKSSADDSDPEGSEPWGMKPYDVQLIGGLALQNRSVAEIATGEGKTLVATLPACLYALAGRGVHIVTANDYLARRDAEWMSTLYEFLGFTVGAIFNGQEPEDRRSAYRDDITYGSASEFGFDYLRDHSVITSVDQRIQRKPFYALVDEADSVLIDEARVPLIITSPSRESQASAYHKMNGKVGNLAKAQSRLCSRFAREARELIKGGQADAELPWQAGLNLYLVQLGQPLSRSLAKLKEESSVAKLLQKVALYFHREDRRDELFDLKEQLYYTIDERDRSVSLSDMGRQFLAPDDPDAFTLPVVEPGDDQPELERELLEASARLHAVSQLLRAHALYQRDIDYVVTGGEIVIIDRERDRPMPGRRWSEGLHQAVEAKEGVAIQDESETIASVTVQNYFGLYPHLAGMTGTASTSAGEFGEIYGLDVVSVPTNRPCLRIDDEDQIFKTRREKYNSVVEEIATAHGKGQPVLVGTGSIEESELLSRMLRRRKIAHSLLNAKNHAREAEVVSGAGEIGAVTISTNMAGRGTDIRLAEGVPDLGGLLVIGTERHASRRVDRQLRGRCARQGDPGRSCFFVSMEDDLLRRFGNHERLVRIIQMAAPEEGKPIQHKWLSRAIGSAQKRVESAHFESRKHVLKYDNIVARQRLDIYAWRDRILEVEPVECVLECIDSCLSDTGDADRNILASYGIGDSEESDDTWELSLRNEYANRLNPVAELDEVQRYERHLLLGMLDSAWREHLDLLEVLREQSDTYRYAQKDPLLEFRRSAAMAYRDLRLNLSGRIAESLFAGIDRYRADESSRLTVEAAREAFSKSLATQSGVGETSNSERVGRNQPCTCGSGRKFKRCCGKLA